MLTKRVQKKIDGNYTRMLRAVVNNSWKQHPSKQQLYGHLPPITKTIKVRRTRHAGHCWRSKDELIRDVLRRTPSHGRAMVGWPVRTYIHLVCADTGCRLEDLPGAMDDRDRRWKRVRNIFVSSATCWWWWFLLNTDKLSLPYINKVFLPNSYKVTNIDKVFQPNINKYPFLIWMMYFLFLSLSVPIIHHTQQVFRTTSCVRTEQL